jgi:hypothetical protein
LVNNTIAKSHPATSCLSSSASSGREPCAIGANHFRRDIGRIAERSGATRPAVGASASARVTVAHAIIGTSTWTASRVIRATTFLDDQRRDCACRKCLSIIGRWWDRGGLVNRWCRTSEFVLCKKRSAWAGRKARQCGA